MTETVAVPVARERRGVREVPGTYGLPLLGQAFGIAEFMFFRGWTDFFLSRQRRYGSPVFRASFLSKTIVILERSGFEPLFNWDGRLEKEYGFGWAEPPLPLVGNVVPTIFVAGDTHDRYKSLYRQILQQRAPAFVPALMKVADDCFAKWSRQGRFSWNDEAEEFCAAFAFEWFLGERLDTRDVRELYLGLFTHQFGFITRYLPGSLFNRSETMFRRLLRNLDHTAGFEAIVRLAEERGLTDRDLTAKQILFLIGMNTFLGLQSLMKSLIGELTLRPELRRALRGEIAANAGETIGSDLTFAAIANMTLLNKVVKEVLRLHPPVFFIFGRATRDFELQTKAGTFAIPEGEMLMGVIPLAQQDPDVFKDPQAFRPERFDDPALDDHLIWPHAPNDTEVSTHARMCAGKEFALLFGKIVCIKLLADCEWELEKTPTWSRSRFGLNVASPEGDMMVRRFALLSGSRIPAP